MAGVTRIGQVVLNMRDQDLLLAYATHVSDAPVPGNQVGGQSNWQPAIADTFLYAREKLVFRQTRTVRHGHPWHDLAV
ncbi:MAG: hypothetical protein ACRD3Q_22020 [Terriglobales bacterium]